MPITEEHMFEMDSSSVPTMDLPRLLPRMCPLLYEYSTQNNVFRDFKLAENCKKRSLFPYCIVQFAIDKTVTVMPTGWISVDNDQCWWPQESVKRHILFNSEPDVNLWSSFDVKVVHYSRSYASAEVSLKFFENNTDIELYSEEESQSLLTGPSRKKKKMSKIAKGAQDNSIQYTSLTLDTNNLRNVQLEAECTKCHENNALLQTILEKVMQLSTEVKELRKLQPATSGQQSTENIDYLPLSSSEEIIQLNEDLEDANKFNKLARYLGQYGGRDINDCTRRILSILISCSAALGFNWVGGYGKVGMKTLTKLLQLVAVAVRQTQKDAKQVEVETIIKKWLRTALDRAGCRKRKCSEIINEM